MKPLLSRDASRAFDRRIMDAGVPGLILMENAGRGTADLLLRRFAGRLQRPVIIGGTGQNGGDAWVIARRLVTKGITPVVRIAGERSKVAGDAVVSLRALEALGVIVTEIGEGALEPLETALADATVVVEGLFGTGLDRDVEGWRRGVIERINDAAAPTLAIDLPSGIDADTGTFGLRGVFTNPVTAGTIRKLVPGQFVKVRLLVGERTDAVLVPVMENHSHKNSTDAASMSRPKAMPPK